MPIEVPEGLRRLEYDDFGQAAYRVMEAVFAVHNEFGHMFDEEVYQREVTRRLEGALVEVPLRLSFRNFEKTYYLDLVYADGAAFEFKTVDQLAPKHRAQLLNYLLVADLKHGKLVNMGSDSVEHEFVNAALTREQRCNFAVEDKSWLTTGNGALLRDLVIGLLRDWGTCLDVELYEEAVTHFLGGPEPVVQRVDIVNGAATGLTQRVHLADPGVACKLTALVEGLENEENNLRRFLAHTSLDCIHWINIGRHTVSFQTIKR
jgi:GxxExxY protein